VPVVNACKSCPVKKLAKLTGEDGQEWCVFKMDCCQNNGTPYTYTLGCDQDERACSNGECSVVENCASLIDDFKKQANDLEPAAMNGATTTSKGFGSVGTKYFKLYKTTLGNYTAYWGFGVKDAPANSEAGTLSDDPPKRCPISIGDHIDSRAFTMTNGGQVYHVLSEESTGGGGGGVGGGGVGMPILK
jgi:hypothetical protein